MHEIKIRNIGIWNLEIWNSEIWNSEIWNSEIWNSEIRNIEIRNMGERNSDVLFVTFASQVYGDTCDLLLPCKINRNLGIIKQIANGEDAILFDKWYICWYNVVKLWR